MPPEPPNTRWLIDGYNVMHAGALRPPERDHFWKPALRERLVQRLLPLAGSALEVWIVFDGKHEGDHPVADGPANVRVIFAQSADDWILDRVRQAEEPQTLRVVTADRSLAGRARHRGAIVQAPLDCLALCPDLPQGEAGA